MIINIVLILALLYCVRKLIGSLADRQTQRDHKKGQHLLKPQPEFCPECKKDKERHEGLL